MFLVLNISFQTNQSTPSALLQLSHWHDDDPTCLHLFPERTPTAVPNVAASSMTRSKVVGEGHTGNVFLCLLPPNVLPNFCLHLKHSSTRLLHSPDSIPTHFCVLPRPLSTSGLRLPWYKAAVPCHDGSTSARLEQLPAWKLWPHKRGRAWALPAPPRCTAPCSPAAGRRPESPPRWRAAAARRTARGTTRRSLCRGQPSRALRPTSRCSLPSHLDGKCNTLTWNEADSKSKKQKRARR